MAIDHYTTLSLPSPHPQTSPPTPEEIKTAYRLALLTHHPDKSSVNATANQTSIDAIKFAYTVLSDPKSRAEYDRQLILLAKGNGEKDKSFHTGEEVVDLDELGYDENKGVWYRSCRCGEERGYVVMEKQLEDEEKKGGREVVIGCRGCSLWIRVGFGVVDEDSEGRTL